MFHVKTSKNHSEICINMSNTICTPLDFGPVQLYAYLTKFFFKVVPNYTQYKNRSENKVVWMKTLKFSKLISD